MHALLKHKNMNHSHSWKSIFCMKVVTNDNVVLFYCAKSDIRLKFLFDNQLRANFAKNIGQFQVEKTHCYPSSMRLNGSPAPKLEVKQINLVNWLSRWKCEKTCFFNFSGNFCLKTFPRKFWKSLTPSGHYKQSMYTYTADAT